MKSEGLTLEEKIAYLEKENISLKERNRELNTELCDAIMFGLDILECVHHTKRRNFLKKLYVDMKKYQKEAREKVVGMKEVMG